MASYSDRYSVDVDVGNSLSSLDKLQKSVDKINSVFGNLSRTIGQLAIGSFVIDTVRGAKALDDFSRSSGIALQSLMGFTKAIAANGANQDQAVDAIGQFNSKLKEAALGGKEAQDAFLKVGVTLNDIRKLSGEALLRKSFEGLSKNKDDVSRLGQQMGLFGEEFRIVNTSATGVVSVLDDLTARAGENANNVASAAEAYRSFERAISVLKDVALMTIKPIADLVAKLEVKTELVSGILKIGAAYLTLQKVILPLVEVWYNYSKAVLTAGAAQMTFSGMASASMAPLRMLGAFAAEMTAAFKILFQVWAIQGVSAASKLAISLGALASLAARLAILVTVIIGINEAIKGLSDVDPIDYLANKLYDLSNSLFPNATKAIDDFGKSMGMASMEETRAAKAAKENGDAKSDQSKNIRDVQDALKGEKEALANLIQQYQLQNKLSNERYSLDTKLIGASEAIKNKEQERFAAYAKYTEEMNNLNQQIKSKSSSVSPSDQAMVPVLKEAQAKLTAEYEKQIGTLDTLTKQRTLATQAEQLTLFTTKSLVDATRQLNDLQQQTSTALLPELEKKYKDIEYAAKSAADAQIAAEEQRRNAPLSDAERAKYYEAARVKVEELKKATEELDVVERKRALNVFKLKERIDLENELQKIQNETAKLTMSEIERKEYDIAAAAKERAKAQIDAAELERGSPLSAAERQAYYDAATAGVKKLQDAERAHYEESRTWATGWKKAFKDYADNASNSAKLAASVFETATKGMEDAIVNFAKTGKFEWKGFVSSILEELLRAQIQSTIASIFGPLLGGKSSSGGNAAGGGSMILGAIKGIGSLLGFADGGVIPTNKPVIVGERGPEILTGAAGRSVIPNEQAFGGTQVTYNINAVDAQSFKQMIAADPTFLYAVSEQGRRRLPGAR